VRASSKTAWRGRLRAELAVWSTGAAALATGTRPPFILCYHGIGAPAGPDPDDLFIARARFAGQLDRLGALGYRMVTVSELWRRVRAGSALGFGAITFDDGLAQVTSEALPELTERGMQCTFYIATAWLGGRHPHLPEERVLTHDELRGLAGDGVEIGAHSVDHLRLPELTPGAAREQLERSRRELEEIVDRPVQSMAYPFGQYDERTVAAARSAGYETACGCSGPGPWAALSLPREPIFGATSDRRFRLKVAGVYGPVHRLRAVHPARPRPVRTDRRPRSELPPAP